MAHVYRPSGNDYLRPFKDLSYMLEVFYKMLETTSGNDHKFILGVVGFIKQVNKEVGYLRFN